MHSSSKWDHQNETVSPTASFFCSASKHNELYALSQPLLRRIVLMKARAKPRLRDIDGLWRKPVKGLRDATARSGSMRQYIRERALLPADEIDRILALAQQSLTRWQEIVAEHPTPRPELRQWLDVFDAAAADAMRDPPAPRSAHPLICSVPNDKLPAMRSRIER